MNRASDPIEGLRLQDGTWVERIHLEVDGRSTVAPRPTEWGKDLNPFQEDVVRALIRAEDTGRRWILGEAPTAGGKTHLVGSLPPILKRPVVALFPTRALCLEQAAKLKGRLVGAASGKPMTGAEVAEAMLAAFEQEQVVVATPDALLLLLRAQGARLFLHRGKIETWEAIRREAPQIRRFKPEKRRRRPSMGYALGTETREAILAALEHAVVVWDEQHVLAHQVGGLTLLARLLGFGPEASKRHTIVLMLSGTPQIPAQYRAVTHSTGVSPCWVRYDESMEAAQTRGEPTRPWWGPLHVDLFAQDPDASRLRLDGVAPGDPCHPITWLGRVTESHPGRHLLVFDSVRRAMMARDDLRDLYGDRVTWWTQDLRDPRMVAYLQGDDDALPPEAIVVGTSSLDVGIDPRARTLWTEGTNLIAVLQRIGRIGRPAGTEARLEPSALCIVFPKAVDRAVVEDIRNHAERGRPFSAQGFRALLEEAGAAIRLEPQVRERVEGQTLRHQDRIPMVAFVMPSGEVVAATPAGMLRDFSPQGDPLGWSNASPAVRVDHLVFLGAARAQAEAFVQRRRNSRILGMVATTRNPSPLEGRVETLAKRGGSWEWVHARPGRLHPRTLLRIG